jgi:uncharacterized protein (TIGR02147 family)
MSDKSVFEFRDYKSYLSYLESRRPNLGRGFRAALARAASCQTAYISQVLNGKAHFSLEQAHAISKFLILSKDEARFFLMLIEYVRAATSDLKTHFLEIMEEQVQKQLNLKDRFKVKKTLSHEDQTTYYSEWSYPAVHIAVTVPHLQTIDSISDYFQLPRSKVQKILKFLISAGLATQSASGKYQIGSARLHLGNDSELISKHHTNWRIQAISSFERETERDLHYTSIVSLSLEDVLEIKARFVKEIESFNSIVKPSREEAVYCLAVDLFSVDKKQ